MNRWVDLRSNPIMGGNKKIHDDDLALFRDAVSDVKATQGDQIEHQRKKPPPRPLNLSDGDKDGDELADLSIDTPEFFEFRRPGIQHRVYQDLQRGLIPPEENLDMHGMRVTEARGAFSRFLGSALQRGLRCVRIVHGKGRGSEGQQPVLKQKTFQWLQQKEAVLAFVTAPRWDGGSGATYVLLSRKFRDE